MALKIKKSILNDKGQIIEELEGTEAEIESYERKRTKKQESAKSKKGLLLGKEMLAHVQKLIDEAILKHALVASHSALWQTKVIEHHWYRDNGWWWKPQWHNDHYIYMATNQDPSVYSQGTAGGNYITCNSSAELDIKLGQHSGYVDSQLETNALTGQIGNWSGVATSCYAAAPAGTVTSGMINLNMKS